MARLARALVEASAARAKAVTVAKDEAPRAEQTTVREEQLLAVELVAESAEQLRPHEQLRPANEAVLEEAAGPSEAAENDEPREEALETQVEQVAVASPRTEEKDVIVPAAADLKNWTIASVCAVKTVKILLECRPTTGSTLMDDEDRYDIA